jgi:hypothetical protein
MFQELIFEKKVTLTESIQPFEMDFWLTIEQMEIEDLLA